MHGIYCLSEQTAKGDRSHYHNSLSHPKLIRNFNLFQPYKMLNSLTDFIHVKSTAAIQIFRITYVSFGNTHNSKSTRHLLNGYLKQVNLVKRSTQTCASMQISINRAC